MARLRPNTAAWPPEAPSLAPRPAAHSPVNFLGGLQATEQTCSAPGCSDQHYSGLEQKAPPADCDQPGTQNSLGQRRGGPGVLSRSKTLSVKGGS